MPATTNPFERVSWSLFENAYRVQISTKVVDKEIILTVTKGNQSISTEPGDIDFVYSNAKWEHWGARLLHLVEDICHRVGWLDFIHAYETGKVRTHPADPMTNLNFAAMGYERLAKDAEHRGDPAGQDAWLIVKDAIDTAIRQCDAARAQQTWSSGPSINEVLRHKVRTLAINRARSHHDAFAQTYVVSCPEMGPLVPSGSGPFADAAFGKYVEVVN